MKPAKVMGHHRSRRSRRSQVVASSTPIAAVPSEPSSVVECWRYWRAPHHWPPRVLAQCRRSDLELHHDAPVPTSPTTGATYHSSHLVSMSSSTKPPPSPRALSGEPILFDVPQMSSPSHRVALSAVPDPPRRRWAVKFSRPPLPLLRAPTLPCLCVGHALSPVQWAVLGVVPTGHASVV
jgi:hypothetical protein